MNDGFLESTLRGLARTLSNVLVSERIAMSTGLLQAFDPRVRLAGILGLITATVLCRRLVALSVLLLLATAIAIASRVSLRTLATRVWAIVFVFTGVIALPALFLTTGPTVLRLPLLHASISATGVHAALTLMLRVGTAVTLSTALVLATPWSRILRALRWFRMPAEIVTMLAMTHRYIFLLLETTNQMFLARRSRTVGPLSGEQRRQLITRTAGVLLSKSIELSHEVYLAMLSRGFRGDVRVLSELEMKTRDYLAAGACVLVCTVVFWVGR